MRRRSCPRCSRRDRSSPRISTASGSTSTTPTQPACSPGSRHARRDATRTGSARVPHVHHRDRVVDPVRSTATINQFDAPARLRPGVHRAHRGDAGSLGLRDRGDPRLLVGHAGARPGVPRRTGTGSIRRRAGTGIVVRRRGSVHGGDPLGVDGRTPATSAAGERWAHGGGGTLRRSVTASLVCQARPMLKRKTRSADVGIARIAHHGSAA